MSSEGTRERFLYEKRKSGRVLTAEQWMNAKGVTTFTSPYSMPSVGKQKTVSVSHAKSRDGSYREGGPFYTSLVRDFVRAGYTVSNYNPNQSKFYTGPVYGLLPTSSEMKQLGYLNTERLFGDKNESQLASDGTTAISLVSPTNPASNLGTSLAESIREGIPSLPGKSLKRGFPSLSSIRTWEPRTKALKALGSEYLNYQFGWAPLRDEVNDVVSAARNHRELLSQYHRGEGSDTHRTFEFPSSVSFASLPESEPGTWSGLPWEWANGHGTRKVSLVRETKKWFVGCFTYALPSSTDSWRKALGFGSDADALYGLALSPEILWELTPWSWAVDWFSNAGEVITNVSNFGLAGLVMRYGYMMEESIERVVAEGKCPTLSCATYVGGKEPTWNLSDKYPGSYACGTESVTKRRYPASPFGFSVGWEGLSPTQLAITAALGITKLL